MELNNFVTRAAMALRFGDLNMLISDRLTPQSRVMFVRDVVQMATKAAPFLSYDSDPYPVIVDGHIDWVIDAYTTTDSYPYSQNADTSALPSNSGLAGQNFNYVRNSVKVVVDAYTGKMTFYDVTSLTHTTDPILRTWENVFPGMFEKVSQMPKALAQALHPALPVPRGPLHRAGRHVRPLPPHRRPVVLQLEWCLERLAEPGRRASAECPARDVSRPTRKVTRSVPCRCSAWRRCMRRSLFRASRRCRST